MSSDPSSNAVLLAVTRLLNTKDFNYDKIVALIEDTMAEDLVPALMFLTNWIKANVSEKTDISKDENIRFAIDLINRLKNRVPPMALIEALSSLLGGEYQANKPIIILLYPITARIQRLIGTIQSSRLYAHMLRAEGQLLDPFNMLQDFPKCMSFTETKPDKVFQSVYTDHLRLMILEHRPFFEFRAYFERYTSKLVLTNTILSLLSELNEAKVVREMSHRQLLFMFSTLFVYIAEFVKTGDVDGHAICKYLQSALLMSPFCALAIINNIPRDLYIFHLLIPPKLIRSEGSREEAREIITEYYNIIDLSLDSTLDELVQAVPDLFVQYFIPKMSYCVELEPITDSQKIIHMHRTNCSLMQRAIEAYEILASVDDGHLAVCVSGMEQDLLKVMVFNVCNVANMDLPKLHNIHRISSLARTCLSDIVTPKIMSLADEQLKAERIREFCYTYNFLLVEEALDRFSPRFLVQRLSGLVDTQMIARASLMTLFLKSQWIRNIDDIINSLPDCSDIIVRLAILEILDTYKGIKSSENEIQHNNLRKLWYEKIPLQSSNSEAPYVWESIDAIPNTMNSSSAEIMNAMKQTDPLTLIASNTFTAVGLLTFSSKLADVNIARACTQALITLLGSTDDTMTLKFQYYTPAMSLALPHAQFLLRRLMLHNYEEESVALLQALRPVVTRDPYVLHWLSSLLPVSQHLLTDRIRHEFDLIARQVTSADEYYITGENMTSKIVDLYIANQMTVKQNPEIMLRLVVSAPNVIHMFAIIAYSLRNDPIDAIIDDLIVPVFDHTRAWPNRAHQCEFIAQIVAELDTEIGFRFIERLLSMPLLENGVNTARILLTYGNIHLLREICSRVSELIRDCDHRLEAFLSIILVQLQKLSCEKELVRDVLCEMLSRVTEETSTNLQQLVSDSLILVYSVLKLNAYRGDFIRAAGRFPTEQRTKIAVNLQV